MRGLDGWPWNSRSHDFAHDLTYLNLYTWYSNKFGFVSNVLWDRGFNPPTPICVTLTDDLEIQGHVIFARDLAYLSCDTCCSNEFRFVSNVLVLWVIQFIPTTAKCVALMNDLKIQGRVILHMTLPISASTHAIRKNLALLLMFYGSGNSFHHKRHFDRWPWNPRSRYFCTWPYLSQLRHML